MEHIWRNHPFNLQRLDPCSSTRTWFNHLQSQLAEDSFELALVLTWKAWSLRNEDVHDSVVGAPVDIVEWCRRFLFSYREANRITNPASLPEPRTDWQPPA